MPKPIPLVRDTLLVDRREEHEQMLTVGTPEWYAWLAQAETFAFTSPSGTFTARKEQAGNRRGGWYWKAYRKGGGKLASAYLGKSESLTRRTITCGCHETGKRGQSAQRCEHCSLLKMIPRLERHRVCRCSQPNLTRHSTESTSFLATSLSHSLHSLGANGILPAYVPCSAARISAC